MDPVSADDRIRLDRVAARQLEDRPVDADHFGAEADRDPVEAGGQHLEQVGAEHVVVRGTVAIEDGAAQRGGAELPVVVPAPYDGALGPGADVGEGVPQTERGQDAGRRWG